MRILVFPDIFPSEPHPGEGIFILRCAQALRDIGHEILVLRIVPHAPPITPKWSRYHAIPETYQIEGISVRTLRAFIPPRKLGLEFLPWQVHRSVERAIRRFSPDVIHANFLLPCGQVAVRHSVPTVVTAHGSDAYRWPHDRRGLFCATREAIVKATRVTAVSGYIKDCVQAIAPRDVDVIWNGGDERFFYPRDRHESRSQLSIPPNRFVIAFAGNLLRAKGVFDLIEAARRLKAINPMVLIAGAGPEEAALRGFAQRSGVDTRLFGRLPQDELATMFAAADVFTLPSYNEGLPNVICEAMLTGRAIVASAVGGIPEIIDHKRSGLLVRAGDVPGLESALAWYASHPEERKRMELAAQTFAAKSLTWRISARHYEQVFLEAINAA